MQQIYVDTQIFESLLTCVPPTLQAILNILTWISNNNVDVKKFRLPSDLNLRPLHKGEEGVT